MVTLIITDVLTNLSQQQFDIHGLVKFRHILGLSSKATLEGIQDYDDGLVTVTILLCAVKRSLPTSTGHHLVDVLQHLRQARYHQ